jgi:hypothetical protein
MSAGRRLDTEARHQVLAAHLPDEPETQLNEREPVAVRLSEVGKLLDILTGSVRVENAWSACCREYVERLRIRLS